MSMSLPTPSIIFCTSSTSEKPMRCLFETSHLPPTAAECSPAEPRGCRSYLAQTFSRNSTFSFSFSSFTMTEARSPVPRLDGHEPM